MITPYRSIGRCQSLHGDDIVLIEEKKLIAILFEMFKSKFGIIDNLKCDHPGECHVDVFDIPDNLQLLSLKLFAKK